MKKYILLKDLPNKPCWTIISEKDVQRYYDFFSYINSVEWFEEVEEELKPKFKVWDYAVADKLWIYLKINSIFQDWRWEYRYSNWTNWYYKYELRQPTQEELKKYFR